MAATCAGLLFSFPHDPSDEAASEVDNAVTVDLPPAEAASQPASDATEGPEQQAVQAAPAQEAPPPVETPKPADEPPVDPDPQTAETPPPRSSVWTISAPGR